MMHVCTLQAEGAPTSHCGDGIGDGWHHQADVTDGGRKWEWKRRGMEYIGDGKKWKVTRMEIRNTFLTCNFVWSLRESEKKGIDLWFRERQRDGKRRSEMKEIWSNLRQEWIWRDRRRSEWLKEKKEVRVCQGTIGGSQRQLLKRVQVPWWRSKRILLWFLCIQPI